MLWSPFWGHSKIPGECYRDNLCLSWFTLGDFLCEAAEPVTVVFPPPCCPGTLLWFESPLVLQFLLPPLPGTPAWLRCPADRIQLFGGTALLSKPFSYPWVVVPSLSCVWLFAVPWTTARQASLSFTISLSILCPFWKTPGTMELPHNYYGDHASQENIDLCYCNFPPNEFIYNYLNWLSWGNPMNLGLDMLLH